MSERPTVVFLHIPKTAGTTLVQMLRHALGGSSFLINGDANFKAFHALSDREKGDLRFVYGHMPRGMHRLLKQPVQYVTFLRDPVARSISAYQHILETPGHPLHGKAPEAISAEHIIRFDGTNQQTRWLGNYVLSTALHRPDHWLNTADGHNLSVEHLAIAKENLAACSFVGLQEHFEEDLKALFRLLALPAPAALPRLRAAAERPAALSDMDVRLLRQRNDLDEQLYDFAEVLRTARLEMTPEHYGR